MSSGAILCRSWPTSCSSSATVISSSPPPISRCRSPRIATGRQGRQAITVGARKLQDFLRALPDDASLNVEVNGSKMMVRAGRSRFNLQTLPAADYPRIALGTESCRRCRCRRRDLRKLFKLAEFAMAQQDIRYYLNGMLLVVDRARCRRSPPTAIACRGRASRWPERRIAAPGGHPAAQDGARTGQAHDRQRGSASRSTSLPTRSASGSPTSSSCRSSSTASSRITIA